MVCWRACSSGSMEDGADDGQRIVRGQQSGVRGVGNVGRRGASDGVWMRDVLVGRPLIESRDVEQADRLMMDSSMTPGGRMTRGEARRGKVEPGGVEQSREAAEL